MGLESVGRFKPNTQEGEGPAGRAVEGIQIGSKLKRTFTKLILQNAADALHTKRSEKMQAHINSGGTADPKFKMPAPQKREQITFEDDFKKIFDSFEFNTLREIEEEEFLRSGGTPEQLNFLGREDTFLNYPSLSAQEKSSSPFATSHGGSNKYRSDINMMELALDKRALGEIHVHQTPQKYQNRFFDGMGDVAQAGTYTLPLSQGALLTAEVFATICHEERHGTSQVHVPGSFVKAPIARTGYSATYTPEESYETRETIGRLFDEAVTQKSADQNFLTYMQRVGSDTLAFGEAELFVRAKSYAFSDGPYVKERLFLDCTIEALATTFDVPRDLIWRAFIRGQKRGIPMDATGKSNRSTFEIELTETINEAFESLSVGEYVVRGMRTDSEVVQLECISQILNWLPKDARERIGATYFTIPAECTRKESRVA